MDELNVVCIKWGAPFPAEEVNILYRGIKRNTARDVRFFCLTDNRVGLDPGIEVLKLGIEPFAEEMAEGARNTNARGIKLRKISMFNPALYTDLKGPLLALDIDVVISGQIDPLFDFDPGKVCMSKPFKKNVERPTRGEGSVLRFDPKLHPFLYERMATEPRKMASSTYGSEQSYTSQVAFEHAMLSHFPKPWVVSFKQHCRPARPFNLLLAPKEPSDARIICFHGKPSASEAIKGHEGTWRKRTLPAPWIKDHYY